jgi:hypothetical protein
MFGQVYGWSETRAHVNVLLYHACLAAHGWQRID